MYLDPGFGSMLIQIIIALIAAGGATVFALRKKIRKLFQKDSKKNDKLNPTTKATEKIKQLSEDDIIDTLSDDK